MATKRPMTPMQKMLHAREQLSNGPKATIVVMPLPRANRVDARVVTLATINGVPFKVVRKTEPYSVEMPVAVCEVAYRAYNHLSHPPVRFDAMMSGEALSLQRAQPFGEVPPKLAWVAGEDPAEVARAEEAIVDPAKSEQADRLGAKEIGG